ncbi:hypothetical protein OHB41_07770 [Streptomyces sp. NBC_01571]|uniref:hypothetical protein n=1 Tax=Streptomyces sp. NBC_01571 TaxID=2975883 RepID=UPI00224DAF1C|nr:hypothetical protein [Streptomyces sp. NBC_01571]MCX4573083.1 hypothetical protein [Streptomyces sp. NBC_01571]
MTSHVEQQVQARIAAAKQRQEDMRRRRAELDATRRRGLAARHAQKLRNLSRVDTATTADSNRGDMNTVDEGQL